MKGASQKYEATKRKYEALKEAVLIGYRHSHWVHWPFTFDTRRTHRSLERGDRTARRRSVRNRLKRSHESGYQLYQLQKVLLEELPLQKDHHPHRLHVFGRDNSARIHSNKPEPSIRCPVALLYDTF